MGVERVTTLNLQVVQTDVERGLILVEGAVPGRRGRLDLSCATRSRSALPQGRAACPGKFRVPARAEAATAAEPPADGGLTPMKIDITSLDGDAAGSIELADAIFGLEPRAGSDRPHGALPARQAARRHAPGQGPRRHRAHRQEDVQAEGHRPRPSRLGARAAVPRRRSRLRPGRRAAMRTTCPRRCGRWR